MVLLFGVKITFAKVLAGVVLMLPKRNLFLVISIKILIPVLSGTTDQYTHVTDINNVC